MIPIAKPGVGLEEIEKVKEVMLSGMLAQGKMVEELEHRFAEYVGAKYAIAVSNGTCALHIANLAHGIGAGDEVITVSFSFMATASSVLFCGGVPVLVDIDPSSFNINLEAVKKAITPKTKAIQPVHLYGNPVDMDALTKIVEGTGIAIIQDAAQAHGATVRGRKIGEYSTACYSLYPTKNITTGEGGMITTNDAAIAQRCRLLREHGMAKRYHHEILGYNSRMTDISAAIGVVQLSKLASYNERRIENARALTGILSSVKGIIPPAESEGMGHVFHQYTIRVMPEYGVSRDKLAEALRDLGIGSMIYYPIPIHKQQALAEYKFVAHDMAITDELSGQVLSLPVHPKVSKEEIEYIGKTIAGIGK